MKVKFNSTWKTLLSRDRRSKKSLILSIVALVEVVAIMLVSTAAWVETISSILITNSESPGQIETRLNQYANLGSGSGYTQDIDLSTYFRKAGDCHLASATSANGVEVFFPVAQSGSANVSEQYRKADINDKNVNYISFDVKVSAVTEAAKLSFDLGDGDNAFKILVGGAEVAADDTAIRFAVTDNETNTTNIFAMGESTTDVVANTDGSTGTTTVRRFSDYSVGNETVLQVDKGKSKIFTFTLWLQDTARDGSTYAGKTVEVQNLRLVPGKTKISFVDYTSGKNDTSDTASASKGWRWVENDNAKMFLYADGKSYEMKKQSDGVTWIAEVPESLLEKTSATIYFERCPSGRTEGTSNPANADHNSVCYNYWQTTVGAMTLSANNISSIYKAYGATTNYKGYGTWGELIEIRLITENTSILANPGNNYGSAKKVTASFSTDSSVTSEMNYNKIGYESGKNATWRCYVPKDDTKSKNIRFAIDGGSTITSAARTTTETVSTFVITASNFGYWQPGSSVTIGYTNNTSGLAYIGLSEVNGGDYLGTAKTDTKTFKVTAGSQVTLKTVDTSDSSGNGVVYTLDGWYTNQNGTTGKLSSNSVTAPAADGTAKYYAKFKIKTYSMGAVAVTDGVSGSTTGGTVSVSSSTVNSGSSVTFTASAKTGYTFDGWFESATAATAKYTGAVYTFKPSGNTTLYARFTKDVDYYLTGWINKSEVTTANSANKFTKSGTNTYTLSYTFTGDEGGCQYVTIYDGSKVYHASSNNAGSGTAASGTTDTSPNGDNKWKVSASSGSTAVFTWNSSTHILTWSVTVPTKTIYFKPSSGWTSDSAWFAVYAWNSSGGSWYTLNSAGSGYYSASIDASYTSVVFKRMDKDYKSDYNHEWNSTADMTIPSGKNCYTVPDDSQWSKPGSGTNNSNWSAK